MLRLPHLGRTIRLGIKSLLLHKTRSALTMLGIVFGVCSVIAMLAIGEGASAKAQEAIRNLGSGNLIVRSNKPPDSRQASGGGGRGFALDYGLTYQDAYRIAETVPDVVRVLPARIIRQEAQFGVNRAQCQVVGTLAGYAQLTHLPPVRGRFLTDLDDVHRANVCVLTAPLARRLFPVQDPLREAVHVGSFYFRVVGVLEDQGRPAGGTGGPADGATGSAGSSAANTLANRDWEQQVYVPLSSCRALFGEMIVNRSSGSTSAERVELHELIVELDDPSHVEAAAGAVQSLLQHYHDQLDYELIVPLRLLRQAEETKRIFNLVLGAIAAISLLVGGIGIMNIMMATVTERTREIGIRRALGARKRDIVLQFLVETVVLAIGGGVVGLAVGVITPVIVSHYTEIPTIITTWSLVLAFGISALVGLVFGLYPANRAAQLDPIEALRHE